MWSRLRQSRKICKKHVHVSVRQEGKTYKHYVVAVLFPPDYQHLSLIFHFSFRVQKTTSQNHQTIFCKNRHYKSYIVCSYVLVKSYIVTSASEVHLLKWCQTKITRIFLPDQSGYLRWIERACFLQNVCEVFDLHCVAWDRLDCVVHSVRVKKDHQHVSFEPPKQAQLNLNIDAQMQNNVWPVNPSAFVEHLRWSWHSVRILLDSAAGFVGDVEAFLSSNEQKRKV